MYIHNVILDLTHVLVGCFIPDTYIYQSNSRLVIGLGSIKYMGLKFVFSHVLLFQNTVQSGWEIKNQGIYTSHNLHIHNKMSPGFDVTLCYNPYSIQLTVFAQNVPDIRDGYVEKDHNDRGPKVACTNSTCGKWTLGPLWQR